MTKLKLTKKKLPAAMYGLDGHLLGKRQPNPDAGRATANAYLTQSGVRFMSMTFHDPDVTSALLKDAAPRSVRVIIPDHGDLGAILVWNSRGQPRPHFVRMPNSDSKLTGVSVWLWRQLRNYW
jgi:hypothetical protein